MRIPLWIDASRLRVLIFGGGSVGLRRAKLFANSGAQVLVAALDFKERGPYDILVVDLTRSDVDRLIRWADLIVIAVNDQRIASDLYERASRAGKLVNDATNAERTHVVVPYFRDIGGVRVATTSEGAAGTPARLALDVIEDCLAKSWIPTFFKAYSTAKAEAKRSIAEAKKRLAFYQELVEDELFMGYVRDGDLDKAIYRAREILKKYAG